VALRSREDLEHEVAELREKVRLLEAQVARSGALPTGCQRREYRSPITVWGLPLVHVCLGPDPETGAFRGVARGIIAIGDVAFGVAALGGAAVGGLAIGGAALGLISLGGCAVGVLAALGGCAIGGLALGGLAIGGLAFGGLAIGYIAAGGQALGAYPMQGDPVALAPDILRLLLGVLRGHR
jgi:hypothetical protein